MRWGGFQLRVLGLSVGLVAAAVVVTTLAALGASRENALAHARHELRIGSTVFEALFNARHDQLLTTVSVLARDFGFREAATTRDRATIESALENHAERVDASVAMLLDPDGNLVAATPRGLDDEETRSRMRELAARAAWDGQQAATVVLDGVAYQLVIVPVNAPLRIAWVCMGFEIDDALATQVGTLTGLQVSFAGLREGRRTLFASMLGEEARARLVAQWLGGVPARIGDALTLEAPLARHDEYGVLAVLQTSEAAALEPYHDLRARLLQLAGAALLLSMFAGLMFGRGLAGPILALAAAAQRVAGGDYSSRLPARGSDEVADLGRAFNHMQEAISQREQHIVHQGLHDSLTGLPNRAHLRDLLDQAILGRGGDAGGRLAVAILDVDRFKEINDALGHDVGDLVLQHVAGRLEGARHPNDAVARLGADEFVVVLRGTDTRTALARARDLVARVREPVIVDEMHIRVHASVGIAVHPDHGGDAETLLRRADGAMYQAKEQHADVALYEIGQDEQHLRRLGLIRDLQEAIDSEALEVHYQPKVAMRDREDVQLEALLRWRHPGRGSVSPGEFIPLAEQSGTITQLTRWMLAEVVRQMGVWARHGLDTRVSINVSALDLYDDSLAAFLLDHLRRAGVAADRLTLEITEGAVMKDVEYALRVLERIKACGVRLSIDDFGTGYSSLAHLKRMPVDELKIDKSFVLHLRRGSEDEVIVQATIELAHALGLKVVAEGVEDRAGWSVLEQHGCDVAQGFLIARPMPPGDVPGWVDEYRKGEEEPE